MHNLGTVIWFEVVRTLKKKTFWLFSLGFPLIIGAVFGIVYLSNQATEDALEDLSKDSFSFVVRDNSGLVNPDLVAALGGDMVGGAAIDETRRQVISGDIDALIVYPGDLSSAPIALYAEDVGIFNNSRYQSVAELLLKQSVAQNVSTSEASVLSGTLNYESTTYRDGEVYDPLRDMIAPGLFLVLFYFLLATFGNQMLTSTIEEKENRVIEMILTTVKARTLVVGKIISLVGLGFLQTLIVLVPVLVAYALVGSNLDLPSVNLSDLPLDPARILLGAIIFVVSFLLFTGLLVTVGAAMPTAKEASSFFSIVVVLIFGPLYASPLFISSPESPVVKVLTLFPLTAPIPLMLRNAVGNLELWEAVAGIGILLITTVFVLAIAVRVFRQGALEYGRKLTAREIFKF